MPDHAPVDPLALFQGDRLETRRAASFVETWWRVTQALGTTNTPDSVVATVVGEGIRALGADAGSVFLPRPDGVSLEIRGTTGYDPERVEAWRVLPLSRVTPTTEAFVGRAPVFVETVAQAILDYPALREVLAGSVGSLVTLPLMVEGDVLGVLALSFHRPRGFDATDRAFLLSLASLCAQALQRSAALTEAHRLNRQLQFLAEASAVLSRSLELGPTLEAVAQLTIPEVADWCVIYLPGEGGRLDPVTITHQEPSMVSLLRDYTRRHPSHATPDSGVGRVFTTGQSELVAAITDEMYDASPLSGAEKAEIRRLELRSTITVPMRAGGAVVGVLGLGRTRLDRAFTVADLDFAQQVANRAGKAVENARLHQALQAELQERERTQRALDAINAKLEDRVRERTAELQELNEELQAFAHSASHDLRTPIRHITSFAELLGRELPPGNARAGVAHHQVMQGARRLTATVDGLLALSRVSQQALRRAAVPLDEVAASVIASLPTDPARGAVEWRVSPLPVVLGDRDLLTLVLQNLLGNALKYTATTERAVIGLSAGPVGEGTLVTVQDNGVGFDPAYAHKLFQAFQRLHPPQQFEGTGLGLANVRRIIQRHGGQVWAASVPGEGATFTFLLPG